MNVVSLKTIFKAWADAMDNRDTGEGYCFSGNAPSAGAGLNVAVAAGVVSVNSANTRSSVAGGTVSVTAADPTNPRVDIIYYTSAGSLTKSDGTAAASNPVPVAWPSGSCPIAVVFVAPGTTDYSGDSYIFDCRVFIQTPLTTAGDLVRADTAGFPIRLAIGAAGRILSSNGSVPSWGQGPLTTDGDLLIGATAGTATRLAMGTALQYLRTNAGATALEWATLSAGSSGNLYNFLTNPGFEVWQRGAGAFTADGAYTADRWLMDEAGTDTLSVTREGTDKSTNSLYSLEAVFTLGSGAGATQIFQQLSINTNDTNHQLWGQAISARVAVRTATASAARSFIATDGTGGTTTYSGFHTGGSAFENLDVVNLTVPVDATYVRFGVAFAASATVQMDNAILAISATAPTYYGLTPADEWNRCQRYYEIHGDGSVAGGGPTLVTQMSQGNGNTGQGISYSAVKALIPTLTKNGTWSVTNAGQPAVDWPKVGGYRFYALAAAAGAVTVYPDSADDTITSEANP